MTVKSKMISWKGALISLSALILTVGIYNYAAGNIVFPNSFTNGTVADANQVNANFVAINTRQSATAAAIAGTWNYIGSGTITSGTTTCSIPTLVGAITLTSNNIASITESGFVVCPGTSPTAYANPTANGTYAINANGSGTINIAGGAIYSFQASKDLNLMGLAIVTPASGTIELTAVTAARQ